MAVSSAKELRTAQALVQAADEAMYVSKFTTKNRVCSWPPNEEDVTLAEANPIATGLAMLDATDAK